MRIAPVAVVCALALGVAGCPESHGRPLRGPAAERGRGPGGGPPGGVRFVEDFTGDDAGGRIAACIAHLPPTGGTCDARGLEGSQTITQPLVVGSGTKPVVVLLGAATFAASAPITLEQNARVVGVARDATVIRAAPGFDFARHRALVRIGSSAPVNGARLENLMVDGASAPGSVCVYSAHAQEQSGLRDVLVIRFQDKGIWWDGVGAQNSFMENVEALATTGTAATVPVLIDGVLSFRGIRGLTVTAAGGKGVPVGLRLNGITTGTFADMHLEYVTTGVEVGSTSATAGVTIANVVGHDTVNDLVRVTKLASSRVTLQALTKNASRTAVRDEAHGVVIDDPRVQLYTSGPTYSTDALTNYGPIVAVGNELRSTDKARTIDARFGAESFAPGQVAVGSATRHPLRLYAGGAPRVSITPDGNVGVGTATPRVRLEVAGDTHVGGCVRVGNGTLGGRCASDRELKVNVQPVKGALDRVRRLQPVTFEYAREPGRREAGLVAQEVEEVMPQLVEQVGDHRAVRYDLELQMNVLQAVRELSAENEALRGRVERLERAERPAPGAAAGQGRAAALPAAGAWLTPALLGLVAGLVVAHRRRPRPAA
jgi:hypothetical protein